MCEDDNRIQDNLVFKLTNQILGRLETIFQIKTQLRRKIF